jgi:hypothetical protein
VAAAARYVYVAVARAVEAVREMGSARGLVRKLALTLVLRNQEPEGLAPALAASRLHSRSRTVRRSYRGVAVIAERNVRHILFLLAPVRIVQPRTIDEEATFGVRPHAESWYRERPEDRAGFLANGKQRTEAPKHK